MSIEFISDHNLENTLLTFDLPALVVFWASWWEECIQFEHILDALAIEYKDQVIFFKIDTDKYQKTFIEYDFYNTPTLVFFRNAQPVAQYASGETRSPYTFNAVSDFIQAGLDQTKLLEVFGEIQFDENINSTQALTTTAQLFNRDVIQQTLPILLFSYWSHKEHELAPKIERAFDQLSSQYSDQYKFLKLDRTQQSDEMKKIDELYALNFLSGEPVPYPAVYAFYKGQKITSTIEGEENAWFYFQNSVSEFPIQTLLSILIYKLNLQL